MADPLAGLKQMIESLGPNGVQRMAKLYSEFNQLKYLCEAKGWAGVWINERKVVVYNKCSETENLVQTFKALFKTNIKVEYKKIKIENAKKI
jgi:hypothetical protein